MSDAAPIGSPARPYIGGQAVLEGVMMRAPQSFAIVVRRRDGSLHVRERAMTADEERKGFAKLPLARGIASLVESLRLGSESLKFSAEQLERDMEASEIEETAKKTKEAKVADIALKGILGALRAVAYTTFLMLSADGDGGSAAPVDEVKKDDKKGRAPMTVMVVMMVVFMIALPQAAAAGVNKLFHLDYLPQSPQFQALTGAFKLSIVIGYLVLVRNVFTEIRRVFQYHGAEHKTITTYEHGEELTVVNARKHTTLHPRCGTTFLVMVALVSILVFTAVGGLLPKIETGKYVLDQVIFFAEKLPFLPLIAAVTFEIQRVFAKYCTTGPLRALLWPGFLCQKITTIEPDDEQLEVALASLRVTLFREQADAAAKASARAETPSETSASDIRYASFDALMQAPALRRAA